MDTKKHVSNKRIKQNSRKITKQNGNSLPDAKFKIIVISMLNEHRRRLVVLRENFNKEIENIKTEVENKKVNSQNEEYNT